jgi:hypothetical protein
MKLVMTTIAILLIAGLASAADATKKAARGKGKGVRGQITAVAADGSKITVSSGRKKNAQTQEITCDDKTAVSIDGADGKKVADLKEGLYVKVVAPEGGTATSIIATSAKPERKAKKPA